MKKKYTYILISLFSIFITSCKDQPKCEDEDVKNTILEIYSENRLSRTENLRHTAEGLTLFSKKEDRKVINIMTTEENKDLQSCGCEGTIEFKTSMEAFPIVNAIVIYTVQINSEGETIVKVDDISFEHD